MEGDSKLKVREIIKDTGKSRDFKIDRKTTQSSKFVKLSKISENIAARSRVEADSLKIPETVVGNIPGGITTQSQIEDDSLKTRQSVGDMRTYRGRNLAFATSDGLTRSIKAAAFDTFRFVPALLYSDTGDDDASVARYSSRRIIGATKFRRSSRPLQ